YGDVSHSSNKKEGFSLAALFARLIAWFSPELQAKSPGAIPAEEMRYIQKLQSFVLESAKSGKVHSPEIWELAGAYLAYLQGDSKLVDSILSRSDLQKADKGFVAQQRKRIGLLNASLQATQLTSDLRSQLMRDYAAIRPEGNKEDYFCRWSDDAARLMLHNNMVRLHKSRSEDAQAMLWEPDSSQVYSSSPVNHYTLKALENAEKILRNSDPYDQFLKKVSGLDGETVARRLGSRRMKEGDYAGAVSAFERVDARKRSEMYYDSRISSGPFDNPYKDKFIEGESPASYDPYKIAVHLKDLDQKARSGPSDQRAQAFYKLGLAQFNMSHFGNWWSAVDTDWSIYYDYSDKPGDPQLRLARTYFEKSIAAGADRNLEAANRFMIASISYLDSAEQGWDSASEVNLAEEQKKQFQKLGTLEDTSFYKEVIRSCSYYMNFRK
ncbi:MAG: hypothetical protein KDK37_16580, partial [Leptospiraceae bacterium]|nr:hypothetical protein [Leptospiraceae bacterium]